MEHDETVHVPGDGIILQAEETPAVITCSGGVTLPSLGIPAVVHHEYDEADGAQ